MLFLKRNWVQTHVNWDKISCFSWMNQPLRLTVVIPRPAKNIEWIAWVLWNEKGGNWEPLPADAHAPLHSFTSSKPPLPPSPHPPPLYPPQPTYTYPFPLTNSFLFSFFLSHVPSAILDSFFAYDLNLKCVRKVYTYVDVPVRRTGDVIRFVHLSTSDGTPPPLVWKAAINKVYYAFAEALRFKSRCGSTFPTKWPSAVLQEASTFFMSLLHIFNGVKK